MQLERKGRRVQSDLSSTERNQQQEFGVRLPSKTVPSSRVCGMTVVFRVQGAVKTRHYGLWSSHSNCGRCTDLQQTLLLKTSTTHQLPYIVNGQKQWQQCTIAF